VELCLLFGHIPTGQAVHYIFSFPKEGKEKDVISIPYARRRFQKILCIIDVANLWFNNIILAINSLDINIIKL
jgi:hypothetical protein